MAALSSDALGVMLWGSHASGTAHDRSDVDVCLVAGPDVAPDAAIRFASLLAGRLGPDYDVKVFEDLPLYLKGEVLDRGKIISSRDERELWEYLRGFRKVWADQSVQRHGRDEFDRLLAARRSRA